MKYDSINVKIRSIRAEEDTVVMVRAAWRAGDLLRSAPGLRGPRIRSWPLSAGSWGCQWPPDTQVGHISSPYHLIITPSVYRLPRLPHHSLPAGDMSDEEYAEEESM